MDDQQRRAALSQQLAQAGSAHGIYEAQALNGKYDQQWADWYAHYLIQHGWNESFTKTWNISELAQTLRQANTDHRANAPKTPWHDFYAAQLAGRA